MPKNKQDLEHTRPSYVRRRRRRRRRLAGLMHARSSTPAGGVAAGERVAKGGRGESGPGRVPVREGADILAHLDEARVLFVPVEVLRRSTTIPIPCPPAPSLSHIARTGQGHAVWLQGSDRKATAQRSISGMAASYRSATVTYSPGQHRMWPSCGGQQSGMRRRAAVRHAAAGGRVLQGRPGWERLPAQTPRRR